MEFCLFSSALLGWQPARVAEAARAVGFAAVEWESGPGKCSSRRHSGGRTPQGQRRGRGRLCPGQGGVAHRAGPIEAVRRARRRAEELGPYLQYVHVKNIAWRRRAGTWSWQHAGLDAGLLDWRDALSALRRARYTGTLSLDYLGGRPSVALLRREVAFLRTLLSR